MPELFGVNLADARILRQMIDQFRLAGGASIADQAPRSATLRLYLVKLDGTVSGRSGDTPGSQTATICQIGTDGDIEERSQAPTITVYNAFESDSGAADTYVFVAKDVFGVYWVISEDCP